MNRVLQRLSNEQSFRKWDARFMEMAYLVASWSKDPSSKVGCVIVDDKHRVIGVGYNGFPRGVPDYPAWYEDREIKLSMVKHAEDNAISNCNSSTEGATAYVTLYPCSSCAGTLIQSGISRIVYPEEQVSESKFKRYNMGRTKTMLSHAGVEESALPIKTTTDEGNE